MKFLRLDNIVLAKARKWLMLSLATPTEIQTEVGGKWVHDANDTVKGSLED